MLDEGGLHRVQRAVAGEPFDGRDLVALLHDRKGQAGVDPTAVDQHGAGAALPEVAPLLGAGQPEMLAQRVEQGGARVQLQAVLGAVDPERDLEAIGRGVGTDQTGNPRRQSGDLRRLNRVALVRLEERGHRRVPFLLVTSGRTEPIDERSSK
jgi:hypothetical protein